VKHLDLLKPAINVPFIDDPEDKLEDCLLGELDNRINNALYPVCEFADEAFGLLNLSKRQRFFHEIDWQNPSQ
jgi:hypothetical protein